MNRFGPLLVLALGLGLAAASGARNGEAHTDYRRAAWEAQQADAEVDAVLPGPAERLGAWFALAGPGWLGGVGLIVVGALWARRQQAAAFSGEGEGVEVVDLAASLDRVDAAVIALREALADLPMDDPAVDARDRLDLLQAQTIAPLVEGRGQLMARHGVAVFAEYFSPFSAGERQLNRVWSALADGHAVVAREALEQAADSFSQARDAWDRAEAR